MLPMEYITKRDYAIRFNVLIIFVLNILYWIEDGVIQNSIIL